MFLRSPALSLCLGFRLKGPGSRPDSAAYPSWSRAAEPRPPHRKAPFPPPGPSPLTLLPDTGRAAAGIARFAVTVHTQRVAGEGCLLSEWMKPTVSIACVAGGG